MTKRDFVNRIAIVTGYPKTHVDQVINLCLDQITDAIVANNRLELRDFGAFHTVTLPARIGRNPKTGDPVALPASRHVRFRAGKRMRKKLNP
jgi:integration host factor subunit beta